MSAPLQASAFETDEVRKLFGNIMELTDNETGSLRSIRAICPSGDRWRQLLSVIPLDRTSFQIQAGHRRTEVLQVLFHWCEGFRRRRSEGSPLPPRQVETYGYLCILLITLVTLSEGPSSPTQPTNGQVNSTDRDELCRRLIEDDEVRSALLDLYQSRDESATSRPQLSAKQFNRAHQQWSRIDKNTLTFHRRGSTSFIISGLTEDRRDHFALKCVLFPYSDIPVIADSTMRYVTDHAATDKQGHRVEHMVDVWASTTRWVLMDFVRGYTLAEEIEKIKIEEAGHPRSLASGVRLDLMRRLGFPLLDALRELHLQGKQHEDLSPTNIIVDRKVVRGDEREYVITFIDFGKNYLYTGSLSGLEGPEGAFVAPEVRKGDDNVSKADLYSLGKILVLLGDVGQSRGSIVPDLFYGQAPLVARLIEDLIVEDPSQRLLVFQMAADNSDFFGSLAVILKQELEVTQAALEADSKRRELAVPTATQSLVSSLRALFPISREPAKRRRIYRVRRDQGVLSDPRRSMHARWLHVFSILASINFYVTTLVCFNWLLRDMGVDIINPVVQATLRMMDVRWESIPLVDSLRRSDYKIGNLEANLPARLVCLSFAFAAARYYQNILGGITTRVAESPALSGTPTRILAEWSMRIMAIWSSWLILACNLVEVRWWPLGTAIGYSGVWVTNMTGANFVQKYLAEARKRKLSTVPPDPEKITGLDTYLQWRLTSALLILMTGPVAVLIYIGVLKDVWVYCSIVVIINVGLLYVITTGTGALDIRIALNRVYLAAERLRYQAERASGLAGPVIPAPKPVLSQSDP